VGRLQASNLSRWVHAGGRVLPGLQARREVAAQWLERDAVPPGR
jgi:GH24 family phage-related lysozyme (muramidase)